MNNRTLGYVPKNELEKFGAEAFSESPNIKQLSDMLKGQELADEILAVAEKAFIDGFMVAVNSFKQEVVNNNRKRSERN